MSSQCTVASATIRGVEAVPVEVEVVISRGLPGMSIVGMPDAAVKESLQRVRSAIKACGFTMPNDKIVINLAPGSIRKTGSGFDLPIAVAILTASGQVSARMAKRYLWVGELSLEGRTRGVRGTLPSALCARNLMLDLAVSSECRDSAPLDGVRQFVVRSLHDLRKPELDAFAFAPRPLERAQGLDYADILGQDLAKRAMQIAAAGGHGILLMGPPGSGKTMLAQALPSILPPLSEEQRIEAAMVHSVAGESVDSILYGTPPFRRVHHSASTAGLVGGGNPVRPGEISLAHQGVLFLDELAEFSSKSLQALRQPMEQGSVSISRADGTIAMPAKFVLVAASNPCPCGYFGDDRKKCTCPSWKVANYQDRIGGPLMDRIDMHIDVWRCDPTNMLEAPASDVSSAALKQGVLTARDFATWRKAKFGDDEGSSLGSLLGRCRLSKPASALLGDLAKAQGMSGRGISRVLSVSRTIADISESQNVEEEHLLEAMGLRVRKGSC